MISTISQDSELHRKLFSYFCRRQLTSTDRYYEILDFSNPLEYFHKGISAVFADKIMRFNFEIKAGTNLLLINYYFFFRTSIEQLNDGIELAKKQVKQL